MTSDVELLAEATRHVEERAKQLPWADKRPWKTSSHIWLERGVPTLDLHDLGQSLAQEVLRITVLSTEKMTCGAVMVITGAGKHSVGNHSVIKAMVADQLRVLSQTRDWEFSPRGPGKFLLVYDREKAPPAARGELGAGFWLVVLVFLAATLAVFMAD